MRRTSENPTEVWPQALRAQATAAVARSTDRTSFHRTAETRFPIKIDVRVPGPGEPWPYAKMLAWCRANVAMGEWEQHGFQDRKRRDDRGPPIDYARWYFRNEADAVAFNEQWLNGTAAAEIELQRDLEPVARTYSEARGAGATDLAARLAADAIFRFRRWVMPNDDAARRRVDDLLKIAGQRGMLRPVDTAKLKGSKQRGV
jgi:hypothetical protein